MKTEDKIKLFCKFFRYAFTTFLILFVALYISQATGYYEYTMHKKMTFTEDQIKKFEQDVKDGKEIDLKVYLDDTSKNYQNVTSKLGYAVSSKIEEFVEGSIENAFKILGNLIQE